MSFQGDHDGMCNSTVGEDNGALSGDFFLSGR